MNSDNGKNYQTKKIKGENEGKIIIIKKNNNSDNNEKRN